MNAGFVVEGSTRNGSGKKCSECVLLGVRNRSGLIDQESDRSSGSDDDPNGLDWVIPIYLVALRSDPISLANCPSYAIRLNPMICLLLE